MIGEDEGQYAGTNTAEEGTPGQLEGPVGGTLLHGKQHPSYGGTKGRGYTLYW